MEISLLGKPVPDFDCSLCVGFFAPYILSEFPLLQFMHLSFHCTSWSSSVPWQEDSDHPPPDHPQAVENSSEVSPSLQLPESPCSLADRGLNNTGALPIGSLKKSGQLKDFRHLRYRQTTSKYLKLPKIPVELVEKVACYLIPRLPCLLAIL